MHKGFCSLFPSDEFLRSPSSPRGHHPSSGRLCNGVDNRGFVWHPRKNNKSTDFKQILNKKHLYNICLRSVEKQKPPSTPCAWCKCLLRAIERWTGAKIDVLYLGCISVGIYCWYTTEVNNSAASHHMFKLALYRPLLVRTKCKHS